MRGRLAIDTAPLAGRPVIRKQRVQAVGFLKRGIDGLIHGRAIRAIDNDRKRRTHGVGASFQLLQLQRSGWPSQQNRCEQGGNQVPQETPFGVWFFQKASSSNMASLMGTPRTSILVRS